MAATESKYITLAQNVLLEYVYDEDNLKKDDYQIITNLSLNNKSYCSTQGLNNLDNQIFPIDPLVKKYGIVDQSKYNFLKIGNFNTTYLHYDRVKIHLPSTYSFENHDYIGLYLRIYVYDYEQQKTVDLSSYVYDDTKVGSDKNMIFNQDFIYNEQQYGKYLTFEIPSVYEISRQRTNTNTVQGNTINSNLVMNGVSPETPIFLDFSWVISRQLVLGSEYYYLSDINTKSIANQPEYKTLGVQIEESKDGDYFEIYGTYNGNNESLDDWVDEMTMKGRKMKIEYMFSLLEEGILTNNMTVTVIQNFTAKILYRPIITFTNTVAMIIVQMKVIDLVDNSLTLKMANLGLKENLFKYGKNLNKINLDNAFKPKIYNQKMSSVKEVSINDSYLPDINLTKVNYPVIVDRIKILTSATPGLDTEYKAMGLSEIIINPFGSIMKFDIAVEIVETKSIVPYDLTKITENSTLTLSFKDDTSFLEKDIWQQTDENDFENGTVIYKIDQEDLIILKAINANNNNYYLTLKGDDSGMRTLLYSGKFVFYEDIQFLADMKSTEIKNNDYDLGLSEDDISSVLNVNSDTSVQTESNKNMFVFLNEDVDVVAFEEYLSTINADIHFTQAGGNSVCLSYMYFILNLTPTLIIDIKLRPEIMETKVIDFCIGKNKKPTGIVNINDVAQSALAFNCAKR